MSKIRLLVYKIKQNVFWRQLFKNFSTALVGEAGASGLGIISTWLLVRMLGDHDYGVLVLGQSYMTIVDTLINFQSWQAVTKYGAESIARNSEHDLKCVFKYGILVDFITAIVGMIIAVSFTPIVSSLMNWERDVEFCALIFSIEIAFHFAGTSIGALRLLDRFKLVSIQKIASAGVKLLLLIILLLSKTSLIACTVVYVCTDILGHVLLTIFFFVTVKKKHGFSLMDILSERDAAIRARFIKFAFWTNLSSTVDVPVKQLDSMILSTVSYEVVAVFKVFKQIGKVLDQVTTPLRQAILPQFSSLVASNKSEEGIIVVKRLKKTIYIIMIPCIAIFAVFSKEVLNLVFGKIYSNYWYALIAYLYVRVYALANVSIHSYFTALGYVQETFIYSLVSNIIYLLIMFASIKNYGMMGAIVALLVQYIIIINLKYYKIKK